MIITSIVAHIDHGKTTLIDSLISDQGALSKSLAGDIRYLDTRKDEQEREITLKLSMIKLPNGFSFIDTPGHVDFESLIFSSSILCNSHIIVIDVLEGITPRTYSLIKYINPDKSVLFLNKIDKISNYSEIEVHIQQLNGLFGREIFNWDRNNVVIGSGILCCGISYNTNRFSKKNTIKSAFNTFLTLDNKFKNNDVSEIVEKYKLRYKTKKSVFQSVIPLAKSIYESIETVSKGEEMEFYRIIGGGELKAITMHCQFEGNKRERKSVIFVTRLFNGKIEKGDVLYSGDRKVVVEEVYEFEIDKMVKKEVVFGDQLIGLKGDFEKNSAISECPVKLEINFHKFSYYRGIVSLVDNSRREEFKEIMRSLWYVEQGIGCRMNRYGEFEIRCSGVIQFEKMMGDFREENIELEKREDKFEFREYSRIRGVVEEMGISVEIGPIELISEYLDEKLDKNLISNENLDEKLISNENTINNVYNLDKNSLKSVKSCFISVSDDSLETKLIVENMMEMFINSGELIKEEIIKTYFLVSLTNYEGSCLYSDFVRILKKCYMCTDPGITPKQFNLKIFIEMKYIGVIYQVLEKYRALEIEEDYDIDTGYGIISSRVGEVKFKEILEEIQDKTRGTAYFEIKDGSFERDNFGEFDEMIDWILEKKGFLKRRKIVENPEKQKTLKKK